MTPIFIAEVKTVSPWGWRSLLPWEALLERACNIGDWVAVHTHRKWGGSFDLLRRARAATSKPLLAKGIHETDADVDRALDLGADYVLVVGRMPRGDQLSKCLVEPRALSELRELPPYTKAVWNSRDLATGGVKSESFQEAREAWPGWLCQASNLARIEDVHSGADAFLVGTALARWR